MLLLDAAAVVPPALPTAPPGAPAFVMLGVPALGVIALCVWGIVIPMMQEWVRRSEAEREDKRAERRAQEAREVREATGPVPREPTIPIAPTAEQVAQHLRHALETHDAFFGEKFDGSDGLFHRFSFIESNVKTIAEMVKKLDEERAERERREKQELLEAARHITNPGGRGADPK